MPQVAPKGFKDTLDALVERNPAKIPSMRNLGVKLNELDNRQTAESWRGSLNRYRRADDAPEDAILLIAKALKVPRSRFPASKERLTLAKLNGRLQSVEADVAFLMEWVGRGFGALGVPPALRDEARLASADGDPP